MYQVTQRYSCKKSFKSNRLKKGVFGTSPYAWKPSNMFYCIKLKKIHDWTVMNISRYLHKFRVGITWMKCDFHWKAARHHPVFTKIGSINCFISALTDVIGITVNIFYHVFLFCKSDGFLSSNERRHVF